MNKPVVVIGAGGHAAVVVDILRQLECEILALIAKDKPAEKAVFANIPWFDSDSIIETFNKDAVLLVNGIGSLPGNTLRTKIHQQYKALGYQFKTVISPKAIVSDYATLADGVQVMPGCVVNVNAYVGEGTIINTGAIIEHDCYIGRYNHIAPGAVLSGDVITADHVHLGTGASIIQGINIGEYSVVSAGATVTKSLASHKTLYVAKPFVR